MKSISRKTWEHMARNYRTLARKAREAGDMEGWAHYFVKGDECYMMAERDA